MFAMFALAAALACNVPAAEARAQLRLDYAAFDAQAGAHGWRQLSAAGCTDAAVRLLRRYASANAKGLTGDERRELAFHIGQALAFAGRDAASIPEFERAATPGGSAEWQAYVDATLAFLRHDAAALSAARATYAGLAPGSMRLAAIDGFLRCPDSPYAKAVHCAM